MVAPGCHDGVRAAAGADDKGGDAKRAVELVEAIHAIRRAAHRDGVGWVTHVDQLHAVAATPACTPDDGVKWGRKMGP